MIAGAIEWDRGGSKRKIAAGLPEKGRGQGVEVLNSHRLELYVRQGFLRAQL